MGYYTTFNGNISLKNARLTNVQVERLREIVDTEFYHDVLVDDTGVQFNYLSGKYYGFEDSAREIVDHLVGLGYDVYGSIEAHGEESPDIWRVVIRDNKVATERAKIIWPDGTEVRNYR